VPSSSHPPRAFGRAIRRRRRERELSQDTLAARAGITGNHLGEIERGQRDPRLSTVVNLVEALELSAPERAVFWEEALRDGDLWPGR
jgi:predicted transcriptional regulator